MAGRFEDQLSPSQGLTLSSTLSLGLWLLGVERAGRGAECEKIHIQVQEK